MPPPPPPQRVGVLLLLVLASFLLLLSPAAAWVWGGGGVGVGAGRRLPTTAGAAAGAARAAAARSTTVVTMAAADGSGSGGDAGATDRRRAVAAQGLLLSALIASTAATAAPKPAHAAVAKLEPLVPPPLVQYEDPEGLFSLKIPQGWFTKRKNPKGPGGEGILFISGDFNKAITLSVERLRVKPLMKRAGINVTDVPDAGYGTWDAFASKEGMAGLLASHKEAMVGGPTKNVYDVLDESIKTDQGTLTFDFVAEVRVERPDLLMEEMGVSRLERHTTARALLVGDGTCLVCWTAALSTDWGRGYDKLLLDVVASLAPGKGVAEGKKEGEGA